jgi:N-acetyltransferase 10
VRERAREGVIEAERVCRYSNIFVTSPTPENLKTLFEFVLKGLEAIDMKEHMDYSIVQGTSDELTGVIVRINIFRSHRQTIQAPYPSLRLPPLSLT